MNPEEYKGHTEGKREIRHGVFIDIEGRGLHATVAGGFTRADVKLMADAPLLLAEVKRLREGILNVMAGVYDNMYYMNQALDRVIQNES